MDREKAPPPPALSSVEARPAAPRPQPALFAGGAAVLAKRAHRDSADGWKPSVRPDRSLPIYSRMQPKHVEVERFAAGVPPAAAGGVAIPVTAPSRLFGAD